MCVLWLPAAPPPQDKVNLENMLEMEEERCAG